jgi:phenylacetate-CoA ligase
MSLLSVLPKFARRALRKFILRYGKQLDVQRMLAMSRKKAVQASIHAARHSSAYQRLLEERGIQPAQLKNQIEWGLLPILTKANTFERFTLAELSRPLPASELADVLTSSGRGGRSFGFRLTARKQHQDAWFDIDLGLQDVFGVDEKATLLVNCLPMGVVFQSRAVTVANVSVREDMACSILRDVGPQFEQTLLCTDPMFIRRILDEARAAGVDWKALNTSVILGEEMLVEAQRDYLAARMGIDIDQDPSRLIGSSFGVGELGLNLLFETRETIRLRRAMRASAELSSLLCGSPVVESLPSLFCYNPLRTHIEILEAGPDGFGELCITLLDAHAVIPLPRYATGDLARLVSQAELQPAAQLAGSALPWLPVIAVKGRMKDQGVGMPSVERIKELLYLDHAVADQLTGAFRLSTAQNGGVLLSLQANTNSAAGAPEWPARLKALLVLHGLAHVELEMLGPSVFPWRPVLDFERKFAYISTG